MAIAFYQHGRSFGCAAHDFLTLCDNAVYARLYRGCSRSGSLLTGSGGSRPGGLCCGPCLLLVRLALLCLGNGVGAGFIRLFRCRPFLPGLDFQHLSTFFQLLGIPGIGYPSGQFCSFFDLMGTLDANVVVLVLLHFPMDSRQESRRSVHLSLLLLGHPGNFIHRNIRLAKAQLFRPLFGFLCIAFQLAGLGLFLCVCLTSGRGTPFGFAALVYEVDFG